jgi:hypothetical protein
MNLILDIKDVHKRNLFYCDPVNNTVMDDSVFVRTGYSNEMFTLNGIYLNCTLHVNKVDKYFHKYKYMFDYNSNMELIDGLVKLERDIIANYNINGLVPVYKLRDQLLSLHIRVFENDETLVIPLDSGEYTFTLKISGLWQTSESCGLTFKFFSQHNELTIC